MTYQRGKHCNACGHRHKARCMVDVLYDLKNEPDIPPFYLQCWCDGTSGPLIGVRPLLEQPQYRLLR